MGTTVSDGRYWEAEPPATTRMTMAAEDRGLHVLYMSLGFGAGIGGITLTLLALLMAIAVQLHVVSFLRALLAIPAALLVGLGAGGIKAIVLAEREDKRRDWSYRILEKGAHRINPVTERVIEPHTAWMNGDTMIATISKQIRQNIEDALEDYGVGAGALAGSGALQVERPAPVQGQHLTAVGIGRQANAEPRPARGETVQYDSALLIPWAELRQAEDPLQTPLVDPAAVPDLVLKSDARMFVEYARQGVPTDRDTWMREYGLRKRQYEAVVCKALEFGIAYRPHPTAPIALRLPSRDPASLDAWTRWTAWTNSDTGPEKGDTRQSRGGR
jgi:hypothetical protein